jgi:hypothetical protein
MEIAEKKGKKKRKRVNLLPVAAYNITKNRILKQTIALSNCEHFGLFYSKILVLKFLLPHLF